MYRNRKVVDNMQVKHLSDLLGITPELAMILLKRNTKENIDINEMRDYLYSYSISNAPFPHVDEAVALLNRHILAGCKIAIINDYDVDGITSGYIASEMLRFLGVSTMIITSDRIHGGYSISKDLIDRAKEFDASLIITTDNGITAFEPIAYAKELGLEVLVTDHHDPVIENDMQKLPDADVIVEPWLSDCEYSFREICGAFVIFKVAQSLLSEENLMRLNRYDLIPYKDTLIGGFVELAGLATIMDVMPLKGENRALVRSALRRINEGSYFVGIRQLAAKLNIELGKITSNRISFGIGPCFNAESRMTGKITTCLRLLETRDNNEAEKLAAELVRVNELRKAEVERLCQEYVHYEDYEEQSFIFQYIPNALHTLCGIISGRITEETGKPSIVVTDNSKGLLTGSGRSVEIFDIIRTLRKYPQFFDKLGGHPMACGMSFTKEQYEALVQTLSNDLKGLTFPEREQLVDLFINPCYVRNAFLDELVLLEPYGENNDQPVLMATNCTLFQMQPLGKNGEYRKLRLLDNQGKMFDAVLFSNISKVEDILISSFGKECLSELGKGRGNYHVDFVYEPNYRTWNGVTSIQFLMRDLQKAEAYLR